MPAFLDKCVVIGCRLLPVPWSNLSVLPVLHVERLHDDRAFNAALEFCRDYTRLTNCRALATIIPPIAPMLAEELATADFGEDAYAERVGQLALVADIGLHGHYLRTGRQTDGLVHNYWNEHAILASQMTREIDWLESRGLMRRRTYSAGYWYLDDGVQALLERNRFEFDFSRSLNRFNFSPTARSERAATDGAARVRGSNPGRSRPRGIWAVAGICATRAVSSVPRHILRMYWRHLLARQIVTISLYSHDWDMDPPKARITLRDLARIGITFSQLSSLHECTDQ